MEVGQEGERRLGGGKEATQEDGTRATLEDATRATLEGRTMEDERKVGEEELDEKTRGEQAAEEEGVDETTPLVAAT